MLEPLRSIGRKLFTINSANLIFPGVFQYYLLFQEFFSRVKSYFRCFKEFMQVVTTLKNKAFTDCKQGQVDLSEKKTSFEPLWRNKLWKLFSLWYRRLSITNSPVIFQISLGATALLLVEVLYFIFNIKQTNMETKIYCKTLFKIFEQGLFWHCIWNLEATF